MGVRPHFPFSQMGELLNAGGHVGDGPVRETGMGERLRAASGWGASNQIGSNGAPTRLLGKSNPVVISTCLNVAGKETWRRADRVTCCDQMR